MRDSKCAESSAKNKILVSSLFLMILNNNMISMNVKNVHQKLILRQLFFKTTGVQNVQLNSNISHSFLRLQSMARLYR